MRYEDEPFIKVYTRDTIDFLGLSYEARTLCVYLARHVDRAGILRVGKNGLRGVAVAIRADWEKVEGPLQELIDDGRVRFLPEPGALLIPNHIEMQSANASDPARQRKSRETARALLEAKAESIPVTPPSPPVTPSVTTPPESVTLSVTPSVTKRDTWRDDGVGGAVTPSVTLSVTSRSDQIRSDSERGEPPYPPVGDSGDPNPDWGIGAEHHSEVRQLAAPPPTDPPRPERTDLGGLEIETWCEGIARATGATCTAPRSGVDAASLRDLLRDRCPRGLDASERASWLRNEACAYAKAKRGGLLNVKWFVEWMNSLKPTARASPRRILQGADIAPGEESEWQKSERAKGSTVAF